ncbi:multiple epidermal growth factor-like domains protein 10 isoform X2 [Pomacea canaliculata]|uniref:multiple epidermal growth factor-like domains protein 10 isoform X2 n=1 Tax=Pomacea canaliculata TaxID=400727 RepID=UPI000D733B1C|nr:multiple epidermal growth factor-like domains protein 10 isoform X2 [Pomacea canaliculata]
MAARVRPEIVKLCVFSQILIFCASQNTHMQNFVLTKACDISSRYASGAQISGNCSAAIDGNTDTNFNISPPNCIHTVEGDTSPFWSVDLGQKIAINTISIYGRASFLMRMICVNVSVDGNIIKRFTDVNGWNNDKYDITVGRVGRVVNITRDCDHEGPTINMCEVQVWVCDDGWYGDTCTQACGQCAGGSVCDKVNGGCVSCQTGFQPPLCAECVDGRYGGSCTQTCGNCPGGSVCDKVTGICASCQTGFKPPLCKECADGWYGANCSQTCGSCVGNSVCDKTTGVCSSCKTRFNPPLCQECVPGWYGKNCNETCGHCLGGNSTCDKTTGSCPSCDGVFQPPLCKEACADGWYGNSCTQACGHCVGGSVCDKGNGNCTSCETGFQLPRCDAMLSSTEDKDTVSLAGPVAGAAVGCSVAFFIIGVVTTLLFKRLRSRQPSSTRRSPEDISMTCELGTSMPIPRPKENLETPSDSSNINLYESLKDRDDNNTSYYVNLTLPPTQ